MSKMKFIEKFTEALSSDTLRHLTEKYSISDFDNEKTEYIIGIANSGNALIIQEFNLHVGNFDGAFPLYHVKFGDDIKVYSIWDKSKFRNGQKDLYEKSYNKDVSQIDFTAEHIKYHTHSLAYQSMFAGGNICRG